jgi:hypothetical protein
MVASDELVDELRHRGESEDADQTAGEEAGAAGPPVRAEKGLLDLGLGFLGVLTVRHGIPPGVIAPTSVSSGLEGQSDGISAKMPGRRVFQEPLGLAAFPADSLFLGETPGFSPVGSIVPANLLGGHMVEGGIQDPGYYPLKVRIAMPSNLTKRPVGRYPAGL